MKLMMYAQVSSLGKVTQLAKRIEFEIHFTRLTFLAVTHGVEKKLSRRLRLSKLQRHPVRARDVLVAARHVAVNVFVLTRDLSISPLEGATVISECVHQIE